MNKLILLLITLTTFTNVSCASFPVEVDKPQMELVETNSTELPNYSNGTSVWAILSVSCVLLSLTIFYNPLAATIIALLGVVFGAIGFNKKLKGLAITGFILSLIVFLVSAFLAFVIFAFGGDPTKIGD